MLCTIGMIVKCTVTVDRREPLQWMVQMETDVGRWVFVGPGPASIGYERTPGTAAFAPRRTTRTVDSTTNLSNLKVYFHQ